MQVDSDRTYRFDIPPAQVWSVLTRVEQYQAWWPWLRRFEPGPLEPGARWSCAIQPPLPYAVEFDLILGTVDPARSVSARVEGGLTGDAHLQITAAPPGSVIRLRSSLRPASPLLRAVARLAPPVVRFGHDWVLDTGLRQFSTRAIAEDPAQ